MKDPRWAEVRRLRDGAEGHARRGDMFAAAYQDTSASVLADEIRADEVTCLRGLLCLLSLVRP